MKAFGFQEESSVLDVVFLHEPGAGAACFLGRKPRPSRTISTLAAPSRTEEPTDHSGVKF